MHQVAKEPAAERVVAHVLDNATRVGIGVGLEQIVGSGMGITPKEDGPDVMVPSSVYNRLVGENRIGVETARDYQEP